MRPNNPIVGSAMKRLLTGFAVTRGPLPKAMLIGGRAWAVGKLAARSCGWPTGCAETAAVVVAGLGASGQTNHSSSGSLRD